MVFGPWLSVSDGATESAVVVQPNLGRQETINYGSRSVSL